MTAQPAHFDPQAELARAFAHRSDPRDRTLTERENRLREGEGYFHYVSATERAADRELAGEVVPRGRTAGERVVNSEGYALVRARGRLLQPLGLRLMSQSELVDVLRARTVIDTSTASGGGLLVESARQVDVTPHPTRLTGLVEIIRAESIKVHQTLTGAFTGAGAETAEATNLPALTALQLPSLGSAGNEDLTMPRFGFSAAVTVGHLMDAGPFAATVDRLVNIELQRSLEAAMVSGPGPGVPGILGTSGLPSVAVASGANEMALADAVETVLTAGFGYLEPLTVLAHPTTMRKLRASQAATTGSYIWLQNLLPNIGQFLDCLAIPVGTVLVGAPREGSVLFLGPDGVELSVSRDDSDNWTTGLATIRLEGRLAFRVRNVGAWCSVTGVA